ncbi:hypothetical protein HETIRDRAFT_164301 [Heterobasidion irregulare TC 32-1]|uniref:Uncharacterized protein n=1 Tax=Heterobasidion irregulare (strain TC 32-1) TaxID=747525 RepID=W4JRR7_HETIT|nr:uncharacterized protein HETIRDRAFT_164301 [Heterobasidion irregulare TC 32-1]ETW75571.1 hypothetical protein HETIRDRAFT_164301 [Heterobasidion irregulare TC 32-1]
MPIVHWHKLTKESRSDSDHASSDGEVVETAGNEGGSPSRREHPRQDPENTCEQTMVMSVPMKRKSYPAASIGECGYDAEDESVPVASCSKSSRGKRLSPSKRQQALENNEWILTVEKHRVHCWACKEWVKLNVKREYDRNNWNAHKLK